MRIVDAHRGDGKRFIVHADEKPARLWSWTLRSAPGREPGGLCSVADCGVDCIRPALSLYSLQ